MMLAGVLAGAWLTLGFTLLPTSPPGPRSLASAFCASTARLCADGELARQISAELDGAIELNRDGSPWVEVGDEPSKQLAPDDEADMDELMREIESMASTTGEPPMVEGNPDRSSARTSLRAAEQQRPLWQVEPPPPAPDASGAPADTVAPGPWYDVDGGTELQAGAYSYRPDGSGVEAAQLGGRLATVLPTKVVVFIDGTWLYYALYGHTGGTGSLIADRYGDGWEETFHVDWSVLPQVVRPSSPSLLLLLIRRLSPGTDRPVPAACPRVRMSLGPVSQKPP